MHRSIGNTVTRHPFTINKQRTHTLLSLSLNMYLTYIPPRKQKINNSQKSSKINPSNPPTHPMFANAKQSKPIQTAQISHGFRHAQRGSPLVLRRICDGISLERRGFDGRCHGPQGQASDMEVGSSTSRCSKPFLQILAEGSMLSAQHIYCVIC